MIIYPAMDLMNHQVVRLKKGEFQSAKIYQNDPCLQAQSFAAQGATHLHIIDLDGAKSGTPHHLPLLKTIKQSTGLILQYGGGLRTEATIIDLLEAGIDKVVLGSFALLHPEIVKTLLTRYPNRIVIAVDVKGDRVTYQGWQQQSLFTLNQYLTTLTTLGVREVMITEIARDGMLEGINVAFYQRLKQSYPGMKITASGGVSSLADIKALKQAAIDGVIIGVALYEGMLTLPEVLSC
jgi:phosphoribosylformimino-5-aminoimidazole carboxamide ribotide isomerase